MFFSILFNLDYQEAECSVLNCLKGFYHQYCDVELDSGWLDPVDDLFPQPHLRLN